eukprot:6187823-Pleurochrysis_carterae.AAC.1
MAAARALRCILTADHVVVVGVKPQLVKDLDNKRKRSRVADLVGWSRMVVEVLSCALVARYAG